MVYFFAPLRCGTDSKSISSELGNNAFSFYGWKQSPLVQHIEQCYFEALMQPLEEILSKSFSSLSFTNVPQWEILCRVTKYSRKHYWLLSSICSSVCCMSQDVFSVLSYLLSINWLVLSLSYFPVCLFLIKYGKVWRWQLQRLYTPRKPITCQVKVSSRRTEVWFEPSH